MNKIYFTSILLFTGCVSSQKGGYEPVTSEQYDPDQVAQRAEELGLRPVDYLHRVNNERLIFYQAHDSKWDDPTINPIFLTEGEAQEYAKRNNMGGLIAGDTSHSYIVREVNYRFEVRQVNDVVNDVLHTSLLLKDSEEYVNQYSLNHADLLIYDLKTGLVVGTSTP
jgi:hypothetical protein